MSDRPLGDPVRQGGSAVGSTVTDSGGVGKHNVLLTRQGAHKVLTVRNKMMGEGVVAPEMEV